MPKVFNRLQKQVGGERVPVARHRGGRSVLPAVLAYLLELDKFLQEEYTDVDPRTKALDDYSAAAVDFRDAVKEYLR